MLHPEAPFYNQDNRFKSRETVRNASNLTSLKFTDLDRHYLAPQHHTLTQQCTVESEVGNNLGLLERNSTTHARFEDTI